MLKDLSSQVKLLSEANKKLSYQLGDEDFNRLNSKNRELTKAETDRIEEFVKKEVNDWSLLKYMNVTLSDLEDIFSDKLSTLRSKVDKCDNDIKKINSIEDNHFLQNNIKNEVQNIVNNYTLSASNNNRHFNHLSEKSLEKLIEKYIKNKTTVIERQTVITEKYKDDLDAEKINKIQLKFEMMEDDIMDMMIEIDELTDRFNSHIKLKRHKINEVQKDCETCHLPK